MMIQPVSSPYAFGYSAPQKAGAIRGAGAAPFIRPRSTRQGEPEGRVSPAGPIVGEDALKRLDQIECKTCSQRKYQDGSDDPSVSFQTPQNIAPESSAAIVRSHEREHVSSEQASAKKDDRKIVSQTVQLYTSICPECGKAYVSGGRTTTLSKADGGKSALEAARLQAPYKSLAVDERT